MGQEQTVVWDKNGVPTSIRVFKVGDNLDSRGLHAFYDASMAGEILKANNKADGSVDFDIGHSQLAGADAPPSSHESAGNGQLRCDATGVWVDDIQWTPDVYLKLRHKKFRFISPAFTFKKVGKRNMINELVNIALTNIPATKGIMPIVPRAVASGKRIIYRSIVSISSDDIVKSKPMAKNASVTKRDEEDDDDKKPADGDDKEPESDKEPVVRDDEDDDGEDGDDDFDPEDTDIDNLDEAEVRKYAAYLTDQLMDLKAQMAKRDEEDEEDDDEEKRSIVNDLYRRRLVSKYSQKKDMLKLSLRDLRAEAKRLGAKAPDVRRSVDQDETDRIVRSEPTNNRFRSIGMHGNPLGATADEILKYAVRSGMRPEQIKTLGLDQKDNGVLYGTNITSEVRKDDDVRSPL